MTNLILTTIGIVLAAFAALIAFDYGGDYFLTGYERAQATTIVNAGNNVSSAYSVFSVQHRRAPTGMAELTATSQGRSLLKQMPEVNGLGTIRGEWMVLNRGQGAERAFVVESISPEVCSTLNERLNSFEEASVIPTAPAFKQGCFAFNGTTVNLFYSFLGPVPSGGSTTPYQPVTAGWQSPAGDGGTDAGSGVTGGGTAILPPNPPSTPVFTPPPLPGAVEKGPEPYGICGSWVERRFYNGNDNAPQARIDGTDLDDLLHKASAYCQTNYGVKSCTFYRADTTWGMVSRHDDVDFRSGTDDYASRSYSTECGTTVPPPVAPVGSGENTDPITGVASCTTGGTLATSNVSDQRGIVASAIPDRMCAGDTVLSPGRRFALAMQTDGNLTLTQLSSGAVMWTSNTGGSGANRLDTQPDGNVVLYTPDNSAKFYTSTNGWGGSRMRLTQNGNLMVYYNGNERMLWQTRTDICLPARQGTEQRAGDFGSVGTVMPYRLCNNEYVLSPNGKFRLTMQFDGNLVLEMGEKYATKIWNSGTTQSYAMDAQGDGNQVLYRRSGTAEWSTGTNGWGDAKMMVQDDGNLVVRTRENDRLLWETRSIYCPPSEKGVETRSGDFGTVGKTVSPRLCGNEYVTSPNGRFRLTQQADGNLVLGMGTDYSTTIWSSGSAGRNVFATFVQSDGNVRSLNRAGDGVWSTGTNGWGNAQWMVQDDGNLVVRTSDNGRLLWETRSIYCLPSEKGVSTIVGDYGVSGRSVYARLCANEYVTSPNGRFRLSMLPNGTLQVGMGEDYSTIVWSTAAPGAFATFVQSDGNVRALNRAGDGVWSTGTNGWGDAKFIIQDDGNLVVRTSNNDRLLWETRSAYCLPAEKGVGTIAGDFGILGTSVGQRLCNNEYATSPNGLYRLTMKPDGNLVLGRGKDYADVIWQSGTAGSGGYKLEVQSDGNARIINRNGDAPWGTGTTGWGPSKLIVQDDGNLVVRTPDNTRLLWETRTVYCVPAEKGIGTIVGGYGVSGSIVGPRMCGNEYTTSPNGLFRLTLTPGGNLVLGQGPDFSDVIWQSGTEGRGGYKLDVQSDGNARIINRNGDGVFGTGSTGWGASRLIVQNDGNLVVRTPDNDRLLWETRSDRCLPASVGAGVGADGYGTPGTLVGARICNNEYMTSPNGRFRVTMQPTGSLVIAQGADYSDVIWSSGTDGSGGYKLEAQGDGNMRIINRNGDGVWGTGSTGYGASRLMLLDNGNMIVQSPQGYLLWESRSDRCLPASLTAGVETSPSGSRASRVPPKLCQTEYVDSPSGRFRFTLGADGRAAIYDGIDHAKLIWQSNNGANPSGYRLYVQDNGDVRILNRNMDGIWGTGSTGWGASRLLMQDDGDLAVYAPPSDNRLLWHSNTGGQTGPVPGSVEDKALTIRKSGAEVFSAAAATTFIPSTMADLGLPFSTYGGAGTFYGFYATHERLNYEIKINDEAVCRMIATQLGADVADTSGEYTASEGCASFNSGYYYWRRVDDAQALAQSDFVRSFGRSVFNASANVTSRPTSLGQIGLDSADRSNILGSSGFEVAGENWQFYIVVNSAEACRRIDAAVGNGSRTIDANNGYSYSLSEGCGGSNGKYYYFRIVNPSYDARVASAIRAVGADAAGAAIATGGETTEAGRAAAVSVLNAADADSGFIQISGVYQAGQHWDAEMNISSASVCRRIDMASGNGDRGSNMIYDPEARSEGCGLYNGGAYWYWKRLDTKYAYGTVFDANVMFSLANNDDPNGVFNYLENSTLLPSKVQCGFGPCYQAQNTYPIVGKVNSDSVYADQVYVKDRLYMHPGPSNDAVVRFRAPAAGWYRIVGAFEVGSSNPNTTNVYYGQGSVTMDRATSRRPFDYNRQMAAGETIEFGLNPAGDYSYDSSGLYMKAIYYGATQPPSDAASGDVASKVASLKDARDQLIAAGQAYVSANIVRPTKSADLMPTYLNALPSVAGVGSVAGDFLLAAPNQATIDGFGYAPAFEIPSIPVDVCKAYNEAVNGVGASQSWPAYKSGCFQYNLTGAAHWYAYVPNTPSADSFSPTDEYVSPKRFEFGTSIGSPQLGTDRWRRQPGYSYWGTFVDNATIGMHPGPGTSDKTIVRFVAPYENDFVVKGRFYHPGTCNSGGVTVQAGTQDPVNISNATSTFSFTVHLAAGQKLPFTLSNNGNDSCDGIYFSMWARPVSPPPTPVDLPASRPSPAVSLLATSVLIKSPAGGCLQIAELEAYSGDTNVALAQNGGVASGSNPYSGDAGVTRTNDGVKPAGYPQIFHSSCGSGDYLRITFANPTPIDRLMLYGRADCCGDRDRYSYEIYNGSESMGSGILDARSGPVEVKFEEPN